MWRVFLGQRGWEKGGKREDQPLWTGAAEKRGREAERGERETERQAKRDGKRDREGK